MNPIAIASLSAVLGAACLAVVDTGIMNEQTKEHQLTVKMEQEISYADGYNAALDNVAMGACAHLEGFDKDGCLVRFNKLLARLSESGDAYYQANEVK